MANISDSKLAKLISDADRDIFEIVNFVAVMNTICVLGVVANVMNMVVFYKQGFANTMNISFFGLAISDMCGLLTLLWGGLFLNCVFLKPSEHLDREEVFYLISLEPHCIFARITGWITVYVTAERCLCITFPLKIKQIVTPRTTAITMFLIYAIMMANILPEFGTTSLGWAFHPARNRSMIRLVFAEGSKLAEAIIYIIYSIFGLALCVTVIVFTVVLVVQLKQKSKWRMTANADKGNAESISKRDTKTVTMVVMIATILIVCYVPGACLSLVTFIEPEFSIAGVYVNAFLALWSIAFALDAVNSTINILVYYKMSSTYRSTFDHIFGFSKTVQTV